MKAIQLIPRLWILISLLFTIHILAQTNIVGYEYAFNEGEGLTFTPVTPTPELNLNTTIDVSGLTQDVNMIHMRFLDENGLWSSITSQVFIKPPQIVNSNANIIGYEYAFNNGEDLQFVPVTASANFNLISDFDVSGLINEINLFHIRFLDDQGRWSSMISRVFVRPPDNANTSANIIGYEYGYNDAEAIQFVPIAPTQSFDLITDIDVSTLLNEINIFHIRFLDDQGKWSSMISKVFIRPPDNITANANIIGYEYGFNDGQNIQFVPISASSDYTLMTEIDISALSNSINQIHIRFLDDQGKWSSMISKVFLKPPVPVSLDNNTIVSYEYWIDDDHANKIEVNVDTPVDQFILAEIDMTQLWAGEYRLNTRFKDAYDNYSPVMTDTITKAVLPYAAFSADLTSICEGETINFTSNSVDYDSHNWDFDDGDTSTDINTSHTFDTAGTYVVTLTVEDSVSGLSDSTTEIIEVYEVPVNTVSISTSLPACFGETVTLTADYASGDYLWSNGATTRSIDVTAAGSFTVNISNPLNPLCNSVSSTIDVSFNAEIDNSITNDATTITANQSGASYQWIDCDDGNIAIPGEINQSFAPAVDGNYAVEITINGCTVVSDCVSMTNLSTEGFDIKEIVNIYPNPVNNRLNVSTQIDIVITIYDLVGKRLNRIAIPRGTSELDMSAYNSGLYLLNTEGTFDNVKGRTVFRVIKD